MTDVPHLAFPFRLAPSGRAATVEQDSIDEVAQNAEVCLRTRKGTRVEIPDYGAAPLLFAQQGGRDLDAALADVTRWEPRVDVLAEDAPDRLDDMVRRVRLSMQLNGSD